MKKTLLISKIMMAVLLMLSALDDASAQQNLYSNLPNVSIVSYSQNTGLPNFFRINPGVNMNKTQLLEWFRANLNFNESVSFRSYDTQRDELGFTHIRYKQFIGNYPVDGSMMIAHIKDGRAVSFNGDFFNNAPSSFSVAIGEQAALQFALNKINAIKYKWQNKAEEENMRVAMNNPSFTYYPKGMLAAVHKSGTDYSASSIRLAWKFDIYAEQPLSRDYVYVDVNTGEIIAKEKRILDADVIGTANTVYSGNVTMTSDNYAPNQYRLRETGRGNGIQTYNLSNATTYTNTDFTNNSSAWNLVVPDKAATDAHWGAEMTYDYFKNVHNRNSIDGAGYTLLSYVHYSTNYANAFWDGTRMTYGDGGGSSGFRIMTGLDVCGHEIAHGLTAFTAGLSGGEAGALNEGNSDIFGTTIERYARPSTWDWIMGEDITVNGLGIRTMSNPHLSAVPGPQPNTYLGQYWDPGGEVHKNDGPFIYWYYLLCQGGSGTNDNSNVYNVTGITMPMAANIEFRALTVYMTPGTAYINARAYTIQAAIDLYGACSQQVRSTTNAWYAVGVGAAFSATVTASFAANTTTSCSAPATFNFTNTSTNATNATWNFGDNTTSTVYNPTHTYSAAGTYTVKLKVSSACGQDSVVQLSYITLSPPPSPSATGAFSCPSPASLTLSATGTGTLGWFTSSTGGTSVATGPSYTTPSLSTTTTYYVENDLPGPTGNVGPVNSAFGTGGYHNNTSTQYLIFDVMQNCTLQTVWVDAGAAGNRTITLWNNAGVQISQVIVSIPAGTSTVTLNIPLTPGTGYRLGGTMMNLYRNNSGPTYPYSLSGIVNITGSSAGTGFYYYFYNWRLEAAPCTSIRTPVVASVGGPVVTYNTTAYDTVCQNVAPFTLTGGSPSGGTYSGPGVSGGTFNPAVAGVGPHTITYSYTDGNNCTNVAPHAVYVRNCITGIYSNSIANSMIIYPNPSTGNVTVEIGLQQNGRVEISVMDEIGQLIFRKSHEFFSGNNKAELNLNSLARGVYFIRIQTSEGVVTKKVNLN